MTTFKPAHYGLTFSERQHQTARQYAGELPFSPTWALLNAVTPEDDFSAFLLLAWQYRLKGDDSAGENAIRRLLSMTWPLPSDDVLMAYRAHGAFCQAFELLRAHPMLENSTQGIELIRTQAEALPMASDEDIIAQVWHAVAGMASGIVLEDETAYHTATAVFRRIIDEEIHPEGYFRTAVNVDPEAQSLHNQLLGVQALVWMAEMSAHATPHQNLWTYENRGVSVITAATYPLYYYFYPAEWRWNGSEWRPSQGVEAELAKSLFRQHAGFLEILAGRYPKPLKAVQMILNELRPIYDTYGGGFTTLTHAMQEPTRRRRGGFFKR
jgi:hypothetical protein